MVLYSFAIFFFLIVGYTTTVVCIIMLWIKLNCLVVALNCTIILILFKVINTTIIIII